MVFKSFREVMFKCLLLATYHTLSSSFILLLGCALQICLFLRFLRICLFLRYDFLFQASWEGIISSQKSRLRMNCFIFYPNIITHINNMEMIGKCILGRHTCECELFSLFQIWSPILQGYNMEMIRKYNT